MTTVMFRKKKSNYERRKDETLQTDVILGHCCYKRVKSRKKNQITCGENYAIHKDVLLKHMQFMRKHLRLKISP